MASKVSSLLLISCSFQTARPPPTHSLSLKVSPEKTSEKQVTAETVAAHMWPRGGLDEDWATGWVGGREAALRHKYHRQPSSSNTHHRHQYHSHYLQLEVGKPPLLSHHSFHEKPEEGALKHCAPINPQHNHRATVPCGNNQTQSYPRVIAGCWLTTRLT